MVGGANRAVLYDLYPYVWDLRNMALVAKAFICWLGEYKERWKQENTLLYTLLYPVSNDVVYYSIVQHGMSCYIIVWYGIVL